MMSEDCDTEGTSYFLRNPKSAYYSCWRGGLLERGLIGERGLCKKSYDMDIYDSFQVPLSHIFRTQHNNLKSQIHKFDKLSIPNTIGTKMEPCLAK